MNDGILLTIAIPTYNRYQYLEGCLKATCTIEFSRMEIVVQDNTEDNARGLEIIHSYFPLLFLLIERNCLK